MNPTKQSMNHYESEEAVLRPSLEEVDIICRKCNHLHDEVVIENIGRILKKVRSVFTHEEVPKHHPV